MKECTVAVMHLLTKGCFRNNSRLYCVSKNVLNTKKQRLVMQKNGIRTFLLSVGQRRTLWVSSVLFEYSPCYPLQLFIFFYTVPTVTLDIDVSEMLWLAAPLKYSKVCTYIIFAQRKCKLKGCFDKIPEWKNDPHNQSAPQTIVEISRE